jgi:5-methylcytosine-specific restriction endonuclease McrA
VWSATRAAACELCARDWVPLTYHHLVPRSTHERALKRGWHAEWELNKVAWLCAACHRCVHRVASNEELAQEWHTVEALLEREDVRRFVDWVGRVRWKKR